MECMGHCPATRPKMVNTTTTETPNCLLAELKTVAAYPKPAMGDSRGGEGVAGTAAREALTKMIVAIELQEGSCNSSN